MDLKTIIHKSLILATVTTGLNFGYEVIAQNQQLPANKFELFSEFDPNLIDIDDTYESDSEFAKMLKQKGIKRVLFDYGAREPTSEESKEIQKGFDTVPYCYEIFHQVNITRTEFNDYNGNAGLPRTIHIFLPVREVNLEESVNRDEVDKSVWSTKRESLRSLPIHECGHKIGRIIFGYSIKGIKESNPLKLPQTFYQMFAELKSLNLDGFKYLINDDRLGSHYTNTIYEYVAELFAISRLKPEKLTEAERKFFDKLHNGLMEKGEKFLEDVAKNSRILLDN